MAWFSSLLGSVRAASSQHGEAFVFEQLGASSGTTEPSRPIRKDEEYFAIRVKASRISDVRRWTTTFHAAVQARCRFLHEERGEVELTTFLAPSMMKELDPTNLDRVITLDQLAAGPAPYVGRLRFELGLFSVKGGDLAAPYIELLTSIANASGPGFIAQAASFVEPFTKGLDLILGNRQRAELEIGLEIEWPEARTGTWLLMRTPYSIARRSEFRLHPVTFDLLDQTGAPYSYMRNGSIVRPPYVVISVEAMQQRSDWMLIPDVREAWNAIRRAVDAEAGRERLEGLLSQFRRVCGWSPDLVPSDSERLVAKAEARVSPLLDGRLGPQQLGELEELDLYGALPA